MAIFVEERGRELLGVTMGEYYRQGTVLPAECFPLRVTKRQQMSPAILAHGLVREMSGQVLGSVVPEPHPPVPIHYVNSNRQILQQGLIKLRIVEESRRHGWLSAKKDNRQKPQHPSAGREVGRARMKVAPFKGGF
jgi:hypothetical protein